MSRVIRSFMAVFVLTLLVSPIATLAAELKLDIAAIDKATGAKGTLNKQEGVFKVSFPRTDVKVSVDGTPMPPFMGLTSWAAFQDGVKVEAMVMGDIVLFQDEVNPVMSVALDNGFAVTAIHNHFFFDEPKVYFMHIGGEGKADALASGVRKIIDKTKEIRAASPSPAKGFGLAPFADKSNVSPGPIEAAFGGKGQAKDGMYKMTIGRTTKMPCGCDVGKEMGVNTWAAFYGTDDHAFVDGDFATIEGELQPVLKSLRASGINIVAIHSHMESENPRVVFLHYWGVGSAAELAKSVKAAIDLQKK
jgi:hypothetical protein